MKTKRPKKTYSLRMDPITWNGIVKMATENNLSISDQVEMILKWALKRWTFTQPEGNNPIKRTYQKPIKLDPQIMADIQEAKRKAGLETADTEELDKMMEDYYASKH